MINIECNNVEDLDKQGVYIISNNIDGKVYVGSTTVRFKKRFSQHFAELKNNKHKNSHLQNSWNKYSSKSFKFIIIEICEKDKCLEKEQYWIDHYKCVDRKHGYNINPISSGTPNMSLETIEKRRQTMLAKYKNGELDHIKNMWKDKDPWNKGLKYDCTEHLKVPKKVKGSRETFKNNARDKSFEIEVYDNNRKLLGKWRSSKDLEEWSLLYGSELPIESRFTKPRMGKPVYYLSSQKIKIASETKQLYKGLFFVLIKTPLSDENQIEKLDNIGEG